MRLGCGRGSLATKVSYDDEEGEQVRRFIAGTVVGIVLAFTAMYGVQQLGWIIHGWRVKDIETRAAVKLVDALDTGTLLCTQVPFDVKGNLIDVTILVIPRAPFEHIIRIQDTTNVVLHTVSIQGLTAPEFLSVASEFNKRECLVDE